MNRIGRIILALIDGWPESDDKGTTLAQIQYFAAWCLSDNFTHLKLDAVANLIDRIVWDDYDFAMALYAIIGYPEGVEKSEGTK